MRVKMIKYITLVHLSIFFSGCSTIELIQSEKGDLEGEINQLKITDEDNNDICSGASADIVSGAAIAGALIPVFASAAKNEFKSFQEDKLEEFAASHGRSLSAGNIGCLGDGSGKLTYTRATNNGTAMELVASIQPFTYRNSKLVRFSLEKIYLNSPKSRHFSDQGIHISIKMKYSYFTSIPNKEGIIPVSGKEITIFDGSLKTGDRISCNSQLDQVSSAMCPLHSDWLDIPLKSISSPGYIAISISETGKGQDAAKRASKFLSGLIDTTIGLLEKQATSIIPKQ